MKFVKEVLETIYALMLSDNYRAIRLMKKMGFVIKYLDDGTVKAALNLKGEEPAFKSVEQKSNKETRTEKRGAENSRNRADKHRRSSTRTERSRSYERVTG